MQGQLEFHDSEVRSTTLLAGTLTVAFSAACVHADNAGYVQSLVLELTEAAVDGPLTDGIGRLLHGTLWVDGVALPAVRFPYTVSGRVRMELQFANGIHLAISAASLVCRLTGDPHFIESFAC
jgi:hypothetical protein